MAGAMAGAQKTQAERELQMAKREYGEVQARISEAKRPGGDGDPQYLPWLESRLRALGPKISEMEKAIEGKKAQSKGGPR